MTRRATHALRILCFAVVLATGASAASGEAGASLLTPAVGVEDVDVSACRGVAPDGVRPASAEDIQKILAGDERGWTIRADAGGADGQSGWLIVFRKPVRIGAIEMLGAAAGIRWLKSDASLPADPSRADDWQGLDELGRKRFGAGTLVTLPPTVSTRAIFIAGRFENGRATLRLCRPLRTRLFSLTPVSMAYASSEYTVHPQMGPPYTHSAAGLVGGSIHWQSAGPDKEGRTLSPPISDVNPAWFILAWDVRRPISGLVMNDNFKSFEIDSFIGPDNLNPRAGLDSEWRRIREIKQAGGPAGRVVEFDPVTTRAIRIRILETREPQFAKLVSLHTFTDLGDAPAPAPPARDDEPAPLRIRTTMETDGLFTAVINKPDGTRVRNLVARDRRFKGESETDWDLRDEDGKLVPPGEYRWSAIHAPPLELRYQMCPYPNVDGNPPWLTGMGGPGGWLADHCPNTAVATAGGRTFLSALMAESGVVLIEVDRDGRKKWGRPNFDAWTGVQWMASDGKSVFAASGGTVWSVDLTDGYSTRTLLRLGDTPVRRWSPRGLAARDGTLFVSTRSDPDPFDNAFTAADIDFGSCVPRYRESRQEPGKRDAPDPRNDVLRLLRLTATPPGSESCMTWLESQPSSGNRSHMMLTFSRAVPVGSVMIPVPESKEQTIQLSFLKAGAAFPPNPADAAAWTAFEVQPDKGWSVAVAPPNTMTRAIRVSFIRGEDDMFNTDDTAAFSDKSALDNDVAGGKAQGRRGGDTPKGRDWTGQIEGMKFLRRRFVNAARDANITVNSGVVNGAGEWNANRSTPVSTQSPGIYMMEFQKARAIQGLAIKEVEAARTLIDVWVGDAAAPITRDGDAGWKQVASHVQPRRKYFTNGPDSNPRARYLDGYVDFGRAIETRAVRLRVVEPYLDTHGGVRDDHGGVNLDPLRCRVFGVAALEAIGGEPAMEAITSRRIESYDTRTGTLRAEVVAPPGNGAIAIDRMGNPLVLAEGGVFRVDMKSGQATKLVDDVHIPTALAVDRVGNVFVHDAASERKNVRVYDASGKFVRTIGTPGGFVVGSWDPTRMDGVVSIAVDDADQLWAVEGGMWPKRTTLWNPDGTLKREMLGNTRYGGGGWIDPGDKSRLFYGPLEFRLDWETGKTRLVSLMRDGSMPLCDRPIRAFNNLYLVSQPGPESDSGHACGVVRLYRDGRAVLVAAVGLAEAFPPLADPAVREKLGVPALAGYKFVWSDLNSDGKVQAEEVKITPRPQWFNGVPSFDHELGLQVGAFRYRVTKVLDSGVPVFEEQVVPGMSMDAGSPLFRMGDGTLFRIGQGGRGASGSPEAGFDANGKLRWSYPSDGASVHALYHEGGNRWTPGQVICEFSVVGSARAHAGDLGEFLVTNSNVGNWYLWTSDGLLAGELFRDMRDHRPPGARPWSMSEFQRGLLLERVTAGQEHFAGSFCRTADNRYLAVAGHNFAGVVEVIGLDRFKRMSGVVAVTPEAIARTIAWSEGRERRSVFRRAPVLDCPRINDTPTIDGDARDWSFTSAELGDDAQLSLGFNDSSLFVLLRTRGLGPLSNSGNDPVQLFKTGAAVDLQLGCDPAAPEDRASPVAGDVRLLLTMSDGKPIAALHEPVVPGTADDKSLKITSPIGSTRIDRVRLLPDVKIAVQPSDVGYVLEAAIPLATLGLRPAEGVRLRGDWGVLVSGDDGREVMRRVYWSNQATAIVSDAPSEARLTPNLWGHIRFTAPVKRPDRSPVIGDPLKRGGDATSKQADDLLRDLEDDAKK